MTVFASVDEAALIARVQSAAPPEVTSAARTYSTWGEHALGWIAVSAVGVAFDASRRRDWLAVGVAAVSAHGASVVIKRLVRRPRPDDARIEVHVSTPSNLSFPSAHAASTAAAAVALAPRVGAPVAIAAAGGMGIARVVVGVHYPSDVAAGMLVGITAGVTSRLLLKSS